MMAILSWFPFYGEDFHTATEHLSDAEAGLYIRMLIAASRQPDHYLPEDPKQICRLLRRTAHNAPKVQAVLDKYWTLTEHGWMQRRLQMELQKAEALHAQRIVNLHQPFSAKSRKTKKAKPPTGTPERTSQKGGHNPHLSKDKSAREAREGGKFVDLGEGMAVSQPIIDVVKSGGAGYLRGVLSAHKVRLMIEKKLITEKEARDAGLL